MNGHLKSAVYAAGARTFLVPWAVNLISFNASALRYLPTRRSDGTRNYTAEASQIGTQPDAAYHNDMALNFFARLIVKYRYDFVIELGSYTLDRAWELATTFPETVIHALDITEDFATERVDRGVNVGPNNLHQISNIAMHGGRGLVCATGTLCCYLPKELESLLTMIAKLKLDLAFSEPNTIGEESLDRSLKRTGKSYYHPYLKLLRELEFRLPDNKGKQTRDCVSKYAEERTFVFARAPD